MAEISYVFELTGLPYVGMVVEINGEFFSTTSGFFEGDSQKVIISDATETTIVQTEQDKITQFRVGDSSQFGRLRFFTDTNNPNTEIPKNTPLHHHTVPAQGDNNFMTQHTMNGAVNVFSQNQVNFEVLPEGQITRTTRTTVRSGTTSTPSGGTTGGGMGGY